MAWSDSIKAELSSNPAEGGRVKTAGVFAAQAEARQSSFRDAILAEADTMPRYAGHDSQGRVIAGKEGSMFSAGELNAYDKKDAFKQLQFATANSHKIRGAAVKKAVELDPTEREELLRLAYSGDANDRKVFAQKPISIVYDRLDYIGFAADVLQEMELRQGVIPAVERDINVPAVVVAQDAQTIKTDIKGDRIFFDEFQLESMVTVSIQEVMQRSYAIIDRIFEKVPRQIALEEDRVLVRAMMAAASIRNNVIADTGGTLTKQNIESLALQIERWRLDADKIMMNRFDFGKIRTDIDSMKFDPVTSRDVFVSGYVGKYYGYNLFVTAGIDEDQVNNETIPRGHVFAVAGPRYVGYQAVRVPLDVFNADQFVNAQTAYGWLYYKLQGMLISNPRSVALLRLDIDQNATPSWLA